MNPWIMVVVDSLVLAALSSCRGGFLHSALSSHESKLSFGYFAVPVGVCIIAGASGGAMLMATGEKGRLAGSDIGAAVVLHPEEWVGMDCPLLPFIDNGSMLAVGDWTLVLYFRDCGKCKRALRHYEDVAATSRERKFCLVEVLRDPTSTPSRMTSTTCKTARLLPMRKWFVRAPAEIVLSNGIVVSGSTATMEGD